MRTPTLIPGNVAPRKPSSVILFSHRGAIMADEFEGWWTADGDVRRAYGQSLWLTRDALNKLRHDILWWAKKWEREEDMLTGCDLCTLDDRREAWQCDPDSCETNILTLVTGERLIVCETCRVNEADIVPEHFGARRLPVRRSQLYRSDAVRTLLEENPVLY